MQIQYRSRNFLVEVVNENTIREIKEKLESQVNIPPTYMTLIVEGKKVADDTTVSNLPNGIDSKLFMIGSTEEEIELMKPPERVFRIKDDLNPTDDSRIQNYSSLLIKPHIRKELPEYRFHNIEVLPNLPYQNVAHRILHELANDPGILAILKKHKWSVGSLCELYPEGYVGVSEVCVMGLNENAGQRILLRLRTDDLQGFRKHLSIRKCLYHELAHNVHSDHDDNFYILMRQIEKEASELDWRASRGRVVDASVSLYRSEQHTGSTSSNISTAATNVHTQSYTLGSLSSNTGVYANHHHTLRPSALAGQAAISRLSEEEAEIESGCGSRGGNGSGTGAGAGRGCPCPIRPRPTSSYPVFDDMDVCQSVSEEVSFPLEQRLKEKEEYDEDEDKVEHEDEKQSYSYSMRTTDTSVDISSADSVPMSVDEQLLATAAAAVSVQFIDTTTATTMLDTNVADNIINDIDPDNHNHNHSLIATQSSSSDTAAIITTVNNIYIPHTAIPAAMSVVDTQQCMSRVDDALMSAFAMTTSSSSSMGDGGDDDSAVERAWRKLSELRVATEMLLTGDIPDPKFRRVNTQNKKFVKLIDNVHGAREFLIAAGFKDPVPTHSIIDMIHAFFENS
eukprot:gene4627-9187_t